MKYFYNLTSPESTAISSHFNKYLNTEEKNIVNKSRYDKDSLIWDTIAVIPEQKNRSLVNIRIMPYSSNIITAEVFSDFFGWPGPEFLIIILFAENDKVVYYQVTTWTP
jgi:hypothetical protein